MKTQTTWKTMTAAGAVFLALVATGCSVTQTEEARLPDVEVTREGNLPKYDVDVADVDVTTEKKEVEVPDIDVGTKTKTVEVEVPDVDVKKEKTEINVPNVDVKMPNEQ